MSIIQKLTLAHLKKNKGRTVVTILGICVSVAMITAVFVSIASFMNYIADVTYYSGGHWDAQVVNVTTDELSKLESQNTVSKVGEIAQLGSESSGFMIDYGVSPRTSVGSVYAADSVGLSQTVTTEIDGAMPKNYDEILVEKEFIESNELDWQVGDTVTIPVGTRQYESEGSVLDVTGNYVAGESFTINDIKEYRIAGIVDNNFPTRGYKILRLAEPEELNGATAYIQLTDVNMKSTADIQQIMTACGIDSSRYRINQEYLGGNFSFAADGAFALTIIPMCLVILAVIMIASIALIYNAFGMSLSERTRYLGMLASVGATKSQKSSSVYLS